MENKKFSVWKFDVMAVIYVKYKPVGSFTVSMMIDDEIGKDTILDRLSANIDDMTLKAVNEAVEFVDRFAGRKTLFDKTSKITVEYKIKNIDHKELRVRVDFVEQKPKMIRLPDPGGRSH